RLFLSIITIFSMQGQPCLTFHRSATVVDYSMLGPSTPPRRRSRLLSGDLGTLRPHWLGSSSNSDSKQKPRRVSEDQPSRSLREDVLRRLERSRRPSLPVIYQEGEVPPPPLLPSAVMSSIGRQRSRRPSLIWTENINRYQSMDFDERRFDIMLPQELNFIFVQFEDRDEENVERVAVIERKSLKDVIEGRLKQRGLGLDQVEFFIEKSSTPIPYNADVSCLVGQKIIVRGKGMRMGRHTRSAHSMDDSNADRPSRKISADAVMRKASFANAKMAKHRQQSESRGSNGGSEDMDSSRSRENLQREGSSFGDEPGCSDGGDDNGGSRRARSTTSTRISLFFGKKMDMLNALKTLKETSASRAPEILSIEEHWQQIVRDHEKLPLLLQKQQAAIWEIVLTEWNYLEHLRHMDDLKRYLMELKKSGFLQEIDTYGVFCNYTDLYQCHLNFWKTAVLPMLEASRMSGDPLNPLALWPGFAHMNPQISDHQEYNHTGWADIYIRLHVEHERGYIQRQLKENNLFKEFVEWVEQQDVMKRLKFVETLTTYPMQHITRYGICLNAVLKNTTKEDERAKIQRMIEEANAASKRLNFELDSKDLRGKLMTIMMSIDGCDYIDFDEAERISQWRAPFINLVAPIPMIPTIQHRKVLMKGEVKVKEGKNSPKIDVVCFIFTDIFLMCRLSKKGSDRLRIARPPMHITRIAPMPHETPTNFYLSYGNEFGPINMFLVTTASADDTKRWMEMIQIAQHEFMTLASGRTGGTTRTYLDGSSNGTMGASSSTGMLPPVMPMMSMMGNVHRKSSSMDSQAVAAQQAQHYTMAELRKAGVVSSTEQLDRGGHSEARLPPRAAQKLSVASCVAAPISTSKSSIDLHLAVRPGGGGGQDSPVKPSRSRSNSSGPEIGDACNGVEEKRRSRSPSPLRRHTVEISGRGTPQGRSSPLVTGGRNTPLESVRQSDSARGSPRSGSPALTGSPDCESVSHSPALLVTSTEEDEKAETGSNGHRRFEKRYHTSDGIDVPKSKGSIPGGILKRFSWNVSSAVNTSRGKISRLNEQTRRSSQSSTAASSESFASSTSGVSSASSTLEPTIDELCSAHHISTISVGGDPILPSTSTSQSTLSISLDHDATVISANEKGVCPSTKQSPPLSTTSSSSGSSPPPPLPDSLPPPQNNNTVENPAQAALNCKKELLRFIMDNQLETS
ncbi:hypothetical protein PENTCL1PPCAC_5860, partial [Pristionchus entomophagus]